MFANPSPTEDIKALFLKHCIKEGGKCYLDKGGFTKIYNGIYSFSDEQISILFGAADLESSQKLDMDRFVEFELTFMEPFAEYRILARVINHSGGLTASLVKDYLSKHSNVIDVNSEPLVHEFGDNPNRPISIQDLSQIVKSCRLQRVTREFAKRDASKKGYISAEALLNALESLQTKQALRFTQAITKNFPTVSFGEFVSIFNVFARTDLLTHVLDNIAEKSGDVVTIPSFALAVQRSKLQSVFTPMDISVIFKLMDKTELRTDDFAPLITVAKPINELPKADNDPGFRQSLRALYNFALGSIAGAVGATFVYPIGPSS
jgi:solute carrier family 25 aspartate/glutamate transporter 12/13